MNEGPKLEFRGVPIDGAQARRALENLIRSTQHRSGRVLPPDHPMVVGIEEASNAAAEKSDALRVCDHVRDQIHKIY